MIGEVINDENNNVQKEKARIDFDKVLDQDSSHTLSLQYLTKIAMDNKDYQTCVKYLKRTIKIKNQEKRSVEKEYISLYKVYCIVVSSLSVEVQISDDQNAVQTLLAIYSLPDLSPSGRETVTKKLVASIVRYFVLITRTALAFTAQ